MHVNGISREVIVDTKTVLLDFLREDLRLTGTKQSCDGKGQCGACTVIVNRKAVQSCLTKVADLQGADVPVRHIQRATLVKAHLADAAPPIPDQAAVSAGRATEGMCFLIDHLVQLAFDSQAVQQIT